MKSEKLKLVPALLYAEEIQRTSIELFYTDDKFLDRQLRYYN